MIRKSIAYMAFMVSCVAAPAFGQKSIQSPQVLLGSENASCKVSDAELADLDGALGKIDRTKSMRISRERLVDAIKFEHPVAVKSELISSLDYSFEIAVIPCLAPYFRKDNPWYKNSDRPIDIDTLRKECAWSHTKIDFDKQVSLAQQQLNERNAHFKKNYPNTNIHITLGNLPTSWKAAAFSHPGLKPEARFSTYTKKYASTNARPARVSLLRHFEADYTGIENGIAIIRKRDWGTSPISADNYIPHFSGGEDDLVLIDYLFGPSSPRFSIQSAPQSTQEPNFETVCMVSEYGKSVRVAFNKNSAPYNSNLMMADINTNPATPYMPGWQKITSAAAADVSSKPSGYFFETEKDSATFGRKFSRKFVALKNSDQFASSSPEGISIGTVLEHNGSKDSDVVGSGNVQISADAAIGYQFAWTFEPTAKAKELYGDPYKRTYKFTPFAAISQTSIDAKQVRPDAEGKIEIKETGEKFSSFKRRIAYTDYSFGFRLDREGSKTLDGYDPDLDGLSAEQSSAYLRRGGSTLHGWEYGAIVEGITDNYNDQSAIRYGINVSLPERFLTRLIGQDENTLFPGYKAMLPLDSYARRRSTYGERYRENRKGRSVFDALNNGLFVKWDADFAIDYVDFSRPARNYKFLSGELNEEGERIGLKDSLDYALFGTDLSVDFTKTNLFGQSSDTGWISLGLDYSFRDGIESDTSQFERLTTELKISDPANADRYFSVEYQDGKDFRTQQGDDQIAFKLGFEF